MEPKKERKPKILDARPVMLPEALESRLVLCFAAATSMDCAVIPIELGRIIVAGIRSGTVAQEPMEIFEGILQRAEDAVKFNGQLRSAENN